MTSIIWRGAQDTNWFNANNWNPPQVPGSGDTVTVPSALTNEPVIPNNNTVTIAQNLTDNGTITLKSTGNNTDLIFNGGTTLTLTGGGVISLSDNANNRIYSDNGGTILDNSDTIKGAGQIFASSGLSIVNESSGVINASAAVNALNISSIGITNKGLVESTSTGGLLLQSMTLDQSSGGTLKAAGGNVFLNSSHIIGGKLTTTGKSLIETSGSSTVLDGMVTTPKAAPINITTGSTVQVSDNTNLTIVGVINNVGTISVNSTGHNTDLIVNGGATTLNLKGGGTVALSDNGNNRIYSSNGGATLDNIDNTIKGAGQIFASSGLGIINESGGTIDANAAVNALNINSIAVANKGLVVSTSTGGLVLQGMTLDQSGGGTLKAAGGNVYLSSAHIVGGNLTTAETGLIETSGANSLLDGAGALPVTVTTGSTVQISNNTNLTVIGTIDNDGTLSLNSAGNTTDLIVNGSGTVTLQGGGTIALSDNGNNRIYSSNGGATLDNIDNTIEGAGQIFASSGLGIINESGGTIDANAAVNALNVNSITVTNKGLVESTLTGGLVLQSMTLDQSGGGTLKAAGGNVYLSSAHIVGGNLTTAETGLIETSGANSLLDGAGALPVTVTTGSTVQISNNTNLTVIGTIDNDGTLSLNSAGNTTDLIVNGSGTVTLQGGGTIALSDNGNNRIYSSNGGATLDNIDNTIEGAGQIFASSGLGIINESEGTIDANAAVNALNINSITVTNKGLVESTSTGGLVLQSMTLDQSGGGTLKAAGGNVYLSSAHIVGGNLTTTGTSLIETSGSNSLLDGAGALPVTVSGGSTIQISNNTNLTVIGTIDNIGTLSLNSTGNTTDLIVNGSGTVTLQGGGTIALSDNANNRIYSNNGGTTLDNIDNTIEGAGQIFASSGLSIINEVSGVINANTAVNALNISSIVITNKGLVESTSTGGLVLQSMTLDQSEGGTLGAAGGNVYFNSSRLIGGTLTTTGTSLIETNGANAMLDGTGTLPITITKGSTVRVSDNTNLTIVGTIANSGTISLNSKGHLTDLIVNSGGTVTLKGGGTVALSDRGNNRIYSNNAGTTLDNVDNTIKGAGQIFANAGLSIINEASGVINASAYNNALRISNIGVTNKGLVEATSFGGLILNGMMLDQSGGGALKAAGGDVFLNNSHIIGGTLTTVGPFLIETSGSGSVLDGAGALPVTITSGSTVQDSNNTNLTLTGAIANSGTISVDSTGNLTDVLIKGSVTLSGGGTIALSNSGNNRIYTNNGGSVLTNNGDTIVGAGVIFSNAGLSLANGAGGTIEAAGGTLTIQMGLSNSGVLEANGATLDIQGAVTGLGTGVLANGGTLKFDSSSVSLNGVTFMSPNAGEVILPGGPTPTITGFAYGDSIDFGFTTSNAISEQFVENGGGTSGVLTVYQTISGTPVSIESFTLNGVYTTQDFSVQNLGSSILISDVLDVWNGSADPWNTAADWNGVAKPGAHDDAAVNSGSPAITASTGTIRNLAVGASGTVNFAGSTGNIITGVIYNSGLFELDGVAGQGGAKLTAGSVDNVAGGTIDIGNATLSATDALTTGSIQNSGSIQLTGSGSVQALLHVTGAAGFASAGVLTGATTLAGDSAIKFASGQISTIASGGSLTLSGIHAVVEDASSLGSNSALLGLANVGGALHLENGATLSPTAAAMYDTGSIFLDDASGAGGSSMTVKAFTIFGALDIGNAALSASDTFNATSLNNANGGAISLTGAGTNQALLHVASGSAGFGQAGILTGEVALSGNTAIEFASGSIATIASGASLTLEGSKAYIEDATALNSNSALNVLSTVAGSLSLGGSASVSSTKAIKNTGAVTLDGSGGDGGSSLSTTAKLTNAGTLAIGNASLSSADSVTAASLSNAGAIDLTGNGGNHFASLSVSGSIANNGAVNLSSDAETLKGNISGTGTIDLFDDSTATFGGSVAQSQTVTYHGAGAIDIGNATKFGAGIAGFAAGDSIDATAFPLLSGFSYSFAENGGGTGGVLSVTSGSSTMNLNFAGTYTTADFSVVKDSSTKGALIAFV